MSMTATHNLFLRVLIGREQIDGFHVAEIDVVAQQEYKQQFAHIFLLLVSIQSLVTFELVTNVRQLFIDAFDFRFFALTCPSDRFRCHESQEVRFRVSDTE